MHFKENYGRKIFVISNYMILTLTAIMFICLFLNILAVSLSENTFVLSNEVKLIPKGLNFDAYAMLLENSIFWNSFLISVERVIIGLVCNISIVLITAYPLSKTTREFKSRNFYMWFLFVSTLFSGGIIPLFVLLNELGLLNNIFALILPSTVPVFNIILMLNFFRNLPKTLSEAAELDGCNNLQVLWKIMIPCSLPSIATITLFTIVGHWNAWFDGALFMTSIEHYPLQTYMMTIVIKQDYSSAGINQPNFIASLSNETMKAAQIIVAMLPILIVYPFLQRYFITGIVLGSVKE